MGERVSKLEWRFQKMGSDIEARRFEDSMVSARMREELDTITNTNKENRKILILIFSELID